MANEKYSFVVVKYAGADTAQAALATVHDLAKEKVVKLKDAVAITKNEQGKIKLHQTKDDTPGRGFLKGGVIGIAFAVLFGGAAWVVAGAALGTAFAMFDRGIKDKLLQELGEKMTAAESALALLIEDADWGTLISRMGSQYTGETVVKELVEDHLAAVEALTENKAAVEAIPEELALPETANKS